MKKVLFVMVAAVLAFSAAACESTGEKMCNKTHECAKAACDKNTVDKDNCIKLADEMKKTCLDATKTAEKNKKSSKDCKKCYDAQEEAAKCVLNKSKCKDGVWGAEESCTKEHEKENEACKDKNC